MSSALIEIIAKRALGSAAKKNINSKDPFFEDVPIYSRDGRPTGKYKKHKKGIPPGLSEKDGKVLKRVRRRAYRLDMCLFNCCGIRFGWSSVIGFIPGFGDIVDVFMAWLVVQSCRGIDGGLPTALLSRMYFNIALDFAIGLIPILGDIADAVFRANTRNAWLLEEYLTQKAEEEHKRGRKIQSTDMASGSDMDGPGPQTPPRPHQHNGPTKPQASLPRADSRHGEPEAGIPLQDRKAERRDDRNGDSRERADEHRAERAERRASERKTERRASEKR